MQSDLLPKWLQGAVGLGGECLLYTGELSSERAALPSAAVMQLLARLACGRALRRAQVGATGRFAHFRISWIDFAPSLIFLIRNW